MAKKTRIEDWLVPEKMILLRDWAMNGLTLEEIAKKMDISCKTLYNWRQKNEKLDNVLKFNKDIADAQIEESLFQKAKNGDTTAMIFWLKNRRPKYFRERHLSEQEKEALQIENEMKKLQLEELKRLNGKENENTYRGIPADMIAPVFAKFHFNVQRNNYLEYNLPGGRGSTKSSIISLEIIDLIEKNPTMHAVVCRMVADTMRTSVFNQIGWAIEKLGLANEYKATGNPLEYTKISTGQKIYFRGADDPTKLKSIAVPFGHIGILWFEELDQFKGDEGVRKIQQSVIRGNDTAWIFKSFNPPKSKNNWANEYIALPKKNRLIVESCYTDVPPEWLGKPFLDEAEYLKEVNPDAYENEYLGIANGSGGNVFENLKIREINDEEIATFDRIANGIDWGWYPDPFAFVRCQYNPAQQQLIIFDEFVGQKKKNRETAQIIKDKGLTMQDMVICDSAEPKSITEYREYGVNARGAVKGVGSREYTFKWLASLREIVIDPKRCPKAYEEFKNYEYERNKEGEIITGYPDGNDHCIDAIRYATEQFSRPKATITVDKVKPVSFGTQFEKPTQSFM